MKKVLGIILAASLSFALIACGSSGGGGGGGNNTPPFGGDKSQAEIDATNVQRIVNATTVIDHMANVFDEATSFFDYWDLSTTYSGCGDQGTVTFSDLVPTANGASGTMTFSNFRPYNPNGSSDTECLDGVLIVSGSMTFDATENSSSSTVSGTADGLRITKTSDSSDRTFDGSFDVSDEETPTSESSTVDVTMKMTDNTLSSNNETMVVNFVESTTFTYADDTEVITFSDDLYTPQDGVVTIATPTPVKVVSDVVTEGEVTLTGDIVITIDPVTDTWTADLNGDGDTADAGETGPVPTVERY